VFLVKAETAQEYRQRVARAGGHGRAQKLTAQERSDAARKAVGVRWAKTKKLAAEITTGTKALLKQTKKREAALAKKKQKNA
jgi:hypothetical protein